MWGFLNHNLKILLSNTHSVPGIMLNIGYNRHGFNFERYYKVNPHTQK